MKELVLVVRSGLIEGRRDGISFCICGHLLRWAPVWAALVQRVQNDVATLLIVEPLDVLASRIIDNGRVAAASDLSKDLHDELCFPYTGITHNLEVLGLFPLWNPHHLSQLGRFEADAISLCRFVEIGWRQHDRNAQNATVIHLPEAFHIFWNSKE